MSEKLLFSDKGGLLQLEYAMDAVKMGSTLIGINGGSSIVLIRAKFYDDKREENFDGGIITKLDKRIGYGLSGFTADGRLLIEKMRRFLTNQNFIFDSNPSIEHCSKTLREFSSFVQNCENNGTFISRPPGVGFLLCGIDNSGKFLFQIDPLGRCLQKKIASIGIVRKYACEALYEGYRKRMSSTEMIILGIRCLSTTDTQQPLEENYEIGFMCNGTKEFKKMGENALKEIIKNLKIQDISIAPYLAIKDKFSVFIPHTAGKYNCKRFRKANCPIVERLVCALMMHGRNTGKKLKAIRIVKDSFEIINLLTNENPIQVLINAIINSGPREDSTRIGYTGTARRQAVDVSPLRRINIALQLLTAGARESAFRNLKTISECLSDELINASRGSSNSYAIKKKDEIERVAKANR